MPLTIEEKKAHSKRVAVIRKKLKETYKPIKVRKLTGASKNPWVEAVLPYQGEIKFDPEYAERCTRIIYGDNPNVSGYCGNVREYMISMHLSQWEKLLDIK
jgi:hypothetical protein